ncbi:MAG TPA: DNA polymerase ligase N-terminal domain-containing protein, partial [Gemmatimonadaceae bacterium]|nr:DNA polymerase ligase N-terminal domain-containing protein [Gemmatimonadaceae bacterium]
PSTDPSVKRLAMQVEDHPMSYNAFEGTIPAGQYGAGTVMLWDVGSYEYHGDADDGEDALRRAYERGELEFVLHGERLRGAWALVRMRGGARKGVPWLLIKRRDEYADAETDVVCSATTSVATGRTMEEIAAGR